MGFHYCKDANYITKNWAVNLLGLRLEYWTEAP